jgi:hypothetical protein
MVTFTNTTERLSMQEFFDTLKYLEKSLVVGVEMERPVPTQADSLGRLFNAVGNRIHRDQEDGLQEYKQASATEYNVVYCYHDGTVYCNNGQRGVEIVFCGTNEGMRWIYDRLHRIETKLDELRADNYHYSCSNHITLHALQERKINGIVLKNFFNLMRAYSSALFWLGSGDRANLVRRTVHENAKIRHTFNPAVNNLHQLITGSHHHSMCNFEKQQYDGETANGVFIELRNVDGIRTPSAVAALMMMYKALFMKAVHLSLNGLISIEGAQYDKNVELTRKITMTAPRPNKLTAQEQNLVIEQAKELIAFITPQLKVVSPDAIKPLLDLAGQPISAREGKWKAIDKVLYRANHTLTENEARLISTVVNSAITKDSATDWKKVMATRLDVSTRMIEHMMMKVEEKTTKRFVFEATAGSYIMV